MYDHTLYKQVQISRSDIRPFIKWAVSLVILHMITSIFLLALCGYIPQWNLVRSREIYSVKTIEYYPLSYSFLISYCLFQVSWTTTRCKRFFIYVVLADLSLILPCVFFFIWLCRHTPIKTAVIDVLVVVYNKKWENWVILSRHHQVALDIQSRFSQGVLKLTRLRLINFWASSVKISVEYPVLPDHNSMNNPSVYTAEHWITKVLMDSHGSNGGVLRLI